MTAVILNMDSRFIFHEWTFVLEQETHEVILGLCMSVICPKNTAIYLHWKRDDRAGLQDESDNLFTSPVVCLSKDCYRCNTNNTSASKCICVPYILAGHRALELLKRKKAYVYLKTTYDPVVYCLA